MGRLKRRGALKLKEDRRTEKETDVQSIQTSYQPSKNRVESKTSPQEAVVNSPKRSVRPPIIASEKNPDRISKDRPFRRKRARPHLRSFGNQVITMQAIASVELRPPKTVEDQQSGREQFRTAFSVDIASSTSSSTWSHALRVLRPS